MALEINFLNKSTTSSLRVCRGCLATDARLYDMRQNRLMEAYSTLLSTAVQGTEDLPQYLCSCCALLLLKCDTFRTNCIDSLIVLRNAKQQHLDLTPEHFKIVLHPYNKKSELEKLAIVHTHKSNYFDISIDTDISSNSDMYSDISIDSDDLYEDECLTSDNESNINLKTKPKHEYAAENSDDEIESLLKKHLDNEKSSLLKDFNVNIACEANNAIINIRDHQMHQLSEIVNHIQYSSETSNELLEILNEDILKCENEASKYVNKTTEKCKVIKQQSKSKAKAKTINEQEVAEVKENTNKSELESESKIRPAFINNMDYDVEIHLIKKEDMKLELPQDIPFFETQCDEINEALDSDDDIAIADLKLDSKPSKCKNTRTKKRKVALNTGRCKDIMNRALKLQQKRRKVTEEYFAKHNTEVRHLSKEEQIKEIHDRKESDNYKNGVYKCNICFKGFLNEETHKNHMLLHDDISGKFVCDICQCHFMIKKRLFRHQQRHKKVFICKECGHTTKQSPAATEHYKMHKGNTFSCEHCGKEFQKNSSKYGHIKIHHPDSDQLVRCEVCGDSFNGLAGLQYHENRVHKEMYSPECLCPGCDTQFYCSAAFKAHQGTDGLCDATHKYCVRCGMAFETEELLNEHEAEQRKPQFHFECDVCHETYENFRKLKMHQRQHSYTDLTKEYHEREGVMKSVKKKKYGSDVAICEVCGKSFKTCSLLKQHYISAHSEDKPFKCKICSKGFKGRGQLTQHNYVHTGESPYKCKLCPKSFRRRNNLARHNLVHTGERPHSCDICGKSYQSKGCVKMHIKTVHMKIPMPPRIRWRNKKTE